MDKVLDAAMTRLALFRSRFDNEVEICGESKLTADDLDLILAQRRTFVRPRPRGSKHYLARLTEADVVSMRRRHAKGERLTAIALDYPQVSKVAVHLALSGKTWKHVLPKGRR